MTPRTPKNAPEPAPDRAGPKAGHGRLLTLDEMEEIDIRGFKQAMEGLAQLRAAKQADQADRLAACGPEKYRSADT